MSERSASSDAVLRGDPSLASFRRQPEQGQDLLARSSSTSGGRASGRPPGSREYATRVGHLRAGRRRDADRRARRPGASPSRSASAKPCAMSLIGPQGTPAAVMRLLPLVGPARRQQPLSSAALSCVAVRDPGGVRGEARVAGQVGAPSTSTSRANWASLPTAMIIGRSAVAKTS